MQKSSEKKTAEGVKSTHRLASSERKRFISQIKEIKEIPRHNSKIITLATQDFDMLVMLAENAETVGYTGTVCCSHTVLKVKNGLIESAENSLRKDYR